MVRKVEEDTGDVVLPPAKERNGFWRKKKKKEDIDEPPEPPEELRELEPEPQHITPTQRHQQQDVVDEQARKEPIEQANVNIINPMNGHSASLVFKDRSTDEIEAMVNEFKKIL